MAVMRGCSNHFLFILINEWHAYADSSACLSNEL